ncbi:RnfABCDGE type electron transport complex subunit D [Nonomuraea turcica]|uniref:RnfABCDGE type electron transport complex subunit D n=1 Tax=Nonomuraea sp. G32 TaxID=3067274 RepID=UPI00273C44A9|nr:RnfABCDGE type electron transport complex subunit D [Nonomuraea sp. G32]MDP4501834.1 RnfABCDGE type electron transport complex subunit D [Nonomuraea sp. G32]
MSTTTARRRWSEMAHRLVRWARGPKVLLIGVLLVLVAVTAPGATGGAGRAWLTVALAAGTAAGIEMMITAARRRRLRIPDGAVGTGVILGMILDPSLPLPAVAALAGAAVVIKHLVRIGRGHVFNPAALALVAAGLFGVEAQSWWGVAAAPAYVMVPLVVITGLFIADRVNRLPMVGAFLGAYYLLLILAYLLLALAYTMFAAFTGMAGRVSVVYDEPFVNASLFAGFIMLTDPPTSPGRHADQYIYGVIAAAAGVVGVVLGQAYSLPLGLLAANAWLAVRRCLRRTAATG